MAKEDYTLYSGGLKGAETAFGEAAEKWSIKEVNFTFPGQKANRQKNNETLSDEDLKRGDISMELVSKMMSRTYYETEKIRKVLQTIFHMVNKGHQVFVVGTILKDNTVKGGTGWAVELAKTAHARFTYMPASGGRKRMYWKMSIDLTYPLVPSMGQHDPLDGLITYQQLGL